MKTLYFVPASVLLFVILIALWHFSIQWFDVPPYIVPAPGAVLNSLFRGLVYGSFYPHIAATLHSMVFGYFIGCTLALLIGAIMSEFPLVERFASPYIVALQSMPKVALAPLIIVWFGYGIASKIVMVALICFFPVFVNTVVGLNSVDRDLLSLYRVFSASRLAILFNVKLPSAAGNIFAGLQVSIVMALIGAVVAEFVASRAGLGNLIQSAAVNLDVATMFAAVFLLAMMGVAASWLLKFLYRKIVFWDNQSMKTEIVPDV